jgi:ABC-type transport system substrate-binding protein
MRVALGAALAAVLVVGGASAAVAAKGASSTPQGSVTWLISGEATSLDVKAGNGQSSFGPMIMPIYDELVHVDPVTQKMSMGLAESVTGNADSTIWTIKLRPNLKFSDGTPLDANAVKFNWDRFADPANAATARSLVTGFTSYVVTDPLTLKVTLPQGRGSFPVYLGGGGGSASITGSLGLIASPTAIQKFGSRYGSSADTTVGAGPYLVKEWVRGDHATYVPNPTFYDPKVVKVAELTEKPVVDTAQKANALIAGQGDIGFFPTPNTDTKTLDAAGFKGNGVLQAASIAVTFNTNVVPYDDVRVRKALVMATDQDDVNQKAQAGQVTPTTAWFPKTSIYYDPSLKIPTNKLADAQKLIDAYVAEKGPVNMRFDVVNTLQALGNVLVQQWSRLKNVNINTVIGQNLAPALVTGNYAAALTATPNITTLEDVYGIWHSGQTSNVIGFSNPTVDKLFDENRDIKDPQKQKEAIDGIVKVVVDQALYVPLYYNQNRDYTAKSIKGQRLQTPSHIYPQYLSKSGT